MILKETRCWSFSEQRLTIKDRFRALPALQIACDTQKNIADLKLAELNMLEVASKVSLKAIFERLDFVVTDQISREVDKKIIPIFRN